MRCNPTGLASASAVPSAHLSPVSIPHSYASRVRRQRQALTAQSGYESSRKRVFAGAVSVLQKRSMGSDSALSRFAHARGSARTFGSQLLLGRGMSRGVVADSSAKASSNGTSALLSGKSRRSLARRPPQPALAVIMHPTLSQALSSTQTTDLTLTW